MRWNILVHRPTKELMDRSAARPALAAEAMRSAAKVPDAPSARVLSLVSQTCQRAAIAHSYPLPPGIDIAPPPQAGNDPAYGRRSARHHGGQVALRKRRLDQDAVFVDLAQPIGEIEQHLCDTRLHRQRAERTDDVVRGFEITHHAVERAQRHLWIGAQQMAEVRRRDRQHAAAGLGDGAVRIAALTECAQAAKGITLAQQIEYDLVSGDAVLEQLDCAMGHRKSACTGSPSW